MTNSYPRVWALLGERRGDNNQVLALAEALGLPFEARTLHYNLLRALEGDLLGPSLVSVERKYRQQIAPPWPDLLIAIGRRSVPVARYIRQQNKHRTRLVLIGHPRVDPRDFDLVLTTPQYPVPRHPNVRLLPMAMSRLEKSPALEPGEVKWLAALPRPHLLFAIGGSTKYHDLAPAEMGDAARRVAARAERFGGTAIAVRSPRTEAAVLDAVEQALAGSRHRLVSGPRPRFPVLMADADEFFVTGDSVSMLSEAILTGRPVGMVPISLNAKGRSLLGEDGEKGRDRRRDIRRFWDHLAANRLVGSIDAPVAGNANNPVAEAAAAVRTLLGLPERADG